MPDNKIVFLINVVMHILEINYAPLFLHQYTFTMHRPGMRIVIQWWSWQAHREFIPLPAFNALKKVFTWYEISVSRKINLATHQIKIPEKLNTRISFFWMPSEWSFLIITSSIWLLENVLCPFGFSVEFSYNRLLWQHWQ